MPPLGSIWLLIDEETATSNVDYRVIVAFQCMLWTVWAQPFAGVGGWVNQAYSRLSTTHGDITDCKLVSVVYAGVCVVI